MRVGAIIAFTFAAMGLLATTQNYLINPAIVRANFVLMVVFPGGLAALGVYLWKKADRATAIDAEVVDESLENPLN